ncbi:MAG TPA: NAD(P)/FAD-dependent oxidoreductase [Planctomycetaceae bacterium]|nr:NAD(P)/FAD-dependent oxidoreductase [Planctomycetaceae bacterium]
MESCDCLVVGGGPAGSSCARALVQAGFDVIVLDKSPFPRDKVCAGWITPAVIDELEIDLDDYRAGRVLQPICGFRTGLIGGRLVSTQYGRAVSYGIRRCEFDHYLLARSGARLRLGDPFDGMSRENGHWIVNGAIRAPVVVGAGGHFCPVARLTTESAGGETVVLAQEIEFEMPPDEADKCRVEPQVPELYFCQDLAGYAWCFRKGNFLNVGLGREGESRLSSHVAEFCHWLEQLGRVPLSTHARFRGHAYRLYRGPRRRVAADAVLVIGDAAGLAYPQSGEGIRPAIESGLLAADVIIDARGDYRQAALGALERRLAARFGRTGPSPNRPGLLPAAWRRAIGRRLLATGWFSRHVVIDRWFLHANQPALPSRRVAKSATHSLAVSAPRCAQHRIEERRVP